MSVIVSLLRGVNLGAHNRIKMDALRALYESLGLRQPESYVQSGNVVFKSTKSDLAKLSGRIEQGIEESFGFRCAVILRTGAELRDVVARNPFEGRSGIDPARFLVTFLAREPSPEARAEVLKIATEPEELRIAGREVFIYYPNGLARPKLPWTTIEKKLKVPATGRNWNTVIKLLEIADRLAAAR